MTCLQIGLFGVALADNNEINVLTILPLKFVLSLFFTIAFCITFSIFFLYWLSEPASLSSVSPLFLLFMACRWARDGAALWDDTDAASWPREPHRSSTTCIIQMLKSTPLAVNISKVLKTRERTSSILFPSLAACSLARFNAFSLQLAPPSPIRAEDGRLLLPALGLSFSSG